MKDFLNDNSVFITCASAFIALISLILLFLNFIYLRKRPSKLIYGQLGAFNIYNSLSKTFKKFDIKYDGVPITNSIMYINGSIVCKGKDIKTLHNQITISPPKGCNWLDSYITRSENLKVSSEIEDNHIIITFNKLRTNKSFRINAILQLDEYNQKREALSIHHSLKFDHSIDDTDDVVIETIRYNRIYWSVIVFCFIFSTIGFIYLLTKSNLNFYLQLLICLTEVVMITFLSYIYQKAERILAQKNRK